MYDYCCGEGRHRKRDWIKASLIHKPWIRLFTATLFTLIHDAAGLFSASQSISHSIHWFPYPWQNILAILIPIVFFDCVSELILIHLHDLPLCRKQTINTTIVRIALVGQIITALFWVSLFGLVLYETTFRPCLAEEDFFRCDALVSGVSTSIVVFLVFIRNAKTLKEYNDRVYTYPIICDESLLFLCHFARNKPYEIIASIEQFHSLNRSTFELDWKNEPTYQAIISFATLLLFDCAGIASVTPLILKDSIGETILYASPFILVIIIDIVSEILLLVYHDLLLCNQEEEKLKKPKNRILFNVGRALQVVVNLAWIVSLIYMIYVVVNLDCQDRCQCLVNGTDTVSDCLFNNTISIPPSLHNYTLTNCTMTSTVLQCIQQNPTWTSCILLALVLTDALYSLMDVFFRSNVLPITLPDSVLYLLYWMTEETDKIVMAIGKHEFGWDFVLEDLNDISDSSTLLTESEKHL